MEWLQYSLLSILCFGIASIGMKMPSKRKINSSLTVFGSNILGAPLVLLGTVVLYGVGQLSELKAISWYSIGWGGIMGVNMIYTFKLLSHEKSEVGAVFPVTSSISSFAMILIGVLILEESMSGVQMLGGICVIISAFYVVKKDKGFPKTPRALFEAGVVLTTSIFGKYIQKLAMEHESPTHFLAYQYIGMVFISLAFILLFDRSAFKVEQENKNLTKHIVPAFILSGATVIGGFAILTALQLGTLSMVYSVHSGYTIIAAFLGWVFFKEAFTLKRFGFTCLAIFGMILLRLG